MSKDPNRLMWWPNQAMPLAFYFERDKLLYDKSQGLVKELSYKDALKMADDAEILAKELREAAELIKDKNRQARKL